VSGFLAFEFSDLLHASGGDGVIGGGFATAVFDQFMRLPIRARVPESMAEPTGKPENTPKKPTANRLTTKPATPVSANRFGTYNL